MTAFATTSFRALPGTTAVVLGGAGFIGSWLCDRLVACGVEVHCVDSFLTSSPHNVDHLLDDPRFHLWEADVTQTDLAALLPATVQIDWVLHLASPAAPEHYLRWPTETLRAGSLGTMNGLALASAHGARFLLTSTSEVYGDPLVHPQPESYWGNVNPIGPRSVYDEAKRFAEALVSDHGRRRETDVVIARIFNTYGPRMAAGDGRLAPTLVRQALTGRPMTIAGDGSRTRSLCWVEDTVEGLLALLVSRLPGPVNIGNDAEVTLGEFADHVRTATGTTVPDVSIDVPEDDPHQRCPDLSVSREHLGWSPSTSLTEGVRRLVEAERSALNGSRQRPLSSARA